MAIAKRSNRIRIFESSIEKLGRILSNKWKIKVIFKHDECRTSGTVIYLPTLPDNASQDLMDAMQGHLDHETAHVIFTDFDAFKNLHRRDKKLFTAANALEDPRIEKKMIGIWSGASVNLRRSLEWALLKMKDVREITDPATGQVKKVKPWEGLSDFGKLVYAATIFAQVKFDKDHWFFTEVVDKDVAEKIFATEDILRDAIAAENTHEVVKLAGEFMRRLQQEEDQEEFVDAQDLPDNAKFVPPQSPQDASMFKKPPGAPSEDVFELAPMEEDEEKDPDKKQKAVKVPKMPKDGSKPEDDEDGEEGEGEEDDSATGAGGAGEEIDDEDEDGGASGGTTGEDDDEDDEDRKPIKGGPGEDEEEEVAAQPSTTNGPLPPQNMRMKKSMKKRNLDPTQNDLERDQLLKGIENMLREAATREFKNTDSYLVYTTEGDKVEIIRDGDKVSYKAFMTEATRMVSVVKRKMSRSLLSTNVSRWEGDKLRGKINPRALFRVPIGTSKRVFRTKVESEDFDTAVQIMVDHSGSMSGGKLDLAAKTSIILGEICNQLSIPFSVAGFSTGSPYVAAQRYMAASPEEREIYKRWGDLWVGLYKDFDEMWASSSHKLINMVNNEQMNTYDGEALRYGALRLLNRPEKRKILFWLNDGMPEPNNHDDHEAHVEYAKACGQEVEKMVELFAVGIQTSAVKNFYTNYVVVNSIDDLPGVCLSELDALLRKGKSLAPRRPGGMQQPRR